MSASRILFDARWVANHGIGRFAAEMAKSTLLNEQAEYLRGDFASIFSPLDPLCLTTKLMGHKQWFVSPSYNCPAFHPSRSILTLHDLMHIRYEEYAGLKNRVYYQLLVRRACQQAPLIFTVSEFSKMEICDWAGISPEKIVVVYNGVDQTFHPNCDTGNSERPYLFYIGDKKPHKNILGIMRAYAASRVWTDVDLLFSGAPHPQILELAESLGVSGAIRFAGFIPEQALPGVYKGATAVLLPSFYEGFGLPLLEAFAVGVPVLTSNISAMPEIAGGAALLVDPYCIEQIANGMSKLVNDTSLSDQLIERGLLRAKEFTWEKARAKWDSALKVVLDS